MKKIFSTVITLGIISSLSVVSLAQSSKTPLVNKRQRSQHRSILQGVRSGELTKKETVRLTGEQQDIRREKRAIKSDGVVTLQERAELNRELNQSRRHVYRAKHNQRDRN
jgi:hypothetical protein